MARKPRIEYEGAFYHVLCRGNQKQKIFKDNEDFIKYLELLGGKDKSGRMLMGRQLLSVIAKGYGYRGKEIADYIRKDNSVITRYLQEKDNLKKSIEKAMQKVKEQSRNLNKQV